MADTTVPTDPPPAPQPPAPDAPSWFTRNWKYIAAAVAVLGWGLHAYQAIRTGQPVPAPPVIVDATASDHTAEPGRPYVAGAGGATHPAFGWHNDPAAVAAVLAAERIPSFGDTPAGKVAMGDEDVYLWQAVRKVNNRGPPWYPNVDQKSVGCCVGCGWKQSSDVCQAVQIIRGKAAEWKPLSVEVIYGGSRVEIGGGKIRGDGSVGAWAAKWVSTYGVVPMEPFGSIDLTTFSPTRARQWGSSGVPKELETVAREHPVKSTALVRTWADVKRAIQQGYPVAVCSDQGFTMTRDKDGFARASGSWGHCMSIIGVRSQPREGGFILNSWGDSAHTGPVFPADAPVAGFWADAATIGRMVGQGDSFALSDMTGFPARDNLDWRFILAEPKRPRPRLDNFALANGPAALAW